MKRLMKQEYNQITVMIPTYNRKEPLLRLLKKLKEQTCQNFLIVISDNCSDYDVEAAICEYQSFFGSRLRLVRRTLNVGSSVNVNGTLSLVNTKWGWMLGDDDEPKPKAIETIYSYLDDNVGALHFSVYDLSRFISDKRDIHSLPEFVDLYGTMTFGHQQVYNAQGDLIFLSNKVLNFEVISQYYEQQNYYCYVKVTVLIAILFMLDQCGTFRVVNHNLIERIDGENQHWQSSRIFLGTSTFSHIRFNLTERQRKRLNLIVMFRYTHVLRKYLIGEISSSEIRLIYDGIFKRSLSLMDRLIFRGMLLVKPKGILAKTIIRLKDR